MSEKTLPAGEVAVYQPPASFEVVDRGSAEVIKFDNVGDVFVGRYEYTTRLTDDKGELYPQAIFTGADAQPYCIFPGGTLRRALENIDKGQWVRITYEKNVPTGQPTPMKSYIVERGLV